MCINDAYSLKHVSSRSVFALVCRVSSASLAMADEKDIEGPTVPISAVVAEVVSSEEDEGDEESSDEEEEESSEEEEAATSGEEMQDDAFASIIGTPRSTTTTVRTPVWEVQWRKITEVLQYDDHMYTDMLCDRFEDAEVGSITFVAIVLVPFTCRARLCCILHGFFWARIVLSHRGNRGRGDSYNHTTFIMTVQRHPARCKKPRWRPWTRPGETLTALKQISYFLRGRRARAQLPSTACRYSGAS